MKYFVIFGITLVLVLIILFYNPFLGIYKDQITIEHNYNEEGYTWNYDIKGSSLKLSSEEDNKWVFKANENGVTELTFVYSKEEDKKYEIYYKFRVIGNKIFWLTGEGKGLLNFDNPY